MIYTEEHWTTLKRSSRFDFLFEIALLIANAQSHGKAYRGEEKWDKVEQNFQSVYGRAKYLYCDTRALRDPEHVSFLKDYSVNIYDTHQDYNQYDELVQTVEQWVKGHLTLSTDLQVIPMTSTRNAVIEFLQKNNDRTVRIHQQEYWNKTQLSHYSANPVYFDSPGEISEKDCVIITLPLHGTYDMPGWIESLFATCSAKNVPVFIDCCWAWLQHSFNLDLNHDCIDTVTCTLGKLFPIEGFRNGFKFSKRNTVTKYDTLYSTNRFGNRLLIDLMNKFPADHLVKKYKPLQEFWCNKLGLAPTPSVHNSYCGEDLIWFNEHRMLAVDGLNQNLLQLIPLFENHDMIINYLVETKQDHVDFSVDQSSRAV